MISLGGVPVFILKKQENQHFHIGKPLELILPFCQKENAGDLAVGAFDLQGEHRHGLEFLS